MIPRAGGLRRVATPVHLAVRGTNDAAAPQQYALFPIYLQRGEADVTTPLAGHSRKRRCR
jgi:hypothetical protein